MHCSRPTEKLGHRVLGDANHPRATTAHHQPTLPATEGDLPQPPAAVQTEASAGG